MKKLLLPVLLLCAAPLFAFLFSPAADPKVISTDYFDIIYVEGTRTSAYRLAAEADDIYRRVAGLLAAEPDMRIPVVLSNLEASSNGFTILYPYTKIVLYDVPPDPESSIGNAEDYLLYLFTHELTHAVSLNIRSDLWEFFRPVLGDYYTAPNDIWMMPMHMIEGVTVSFESLEGYGRLKDPFIRQHLLQSALEGEFLGASAASGAYDRFPFASAYYFYGGFFSRYLQETYGVEAYAELWHETGKGWIIPGLSGAFRRVYGKSLREEWEVFAAGFDSEAPPPPEPRLLTGEAGYIGDMTGAGDALYYLSIYGGGLRVYDTAAGTDRFLLNLENPGSAAVDVSADGRRLALGLLEYTAGGTAALTRIYDLKEQVFTGEVIPGLRGGAFVTGGIAGVMVEEGETRLVIRREGETETLLSGGPGVVFGTVRELEPGRYVFLASHRGRRGIYAYGEASGALERVVLPLAGEVYPRGLTVQGGRIFFSYNDDNSFYRLGMIDGGRFYRQSEALSGGVFNPAVLGGRVFHAGLFADGWYLAEHPTAPSSLTAAGVVTFEPAFFEAGAPPAVPESAEYAAGRRLGPRFVLPYIDPGSVTINDAGGLEISGFEAFGLQTYSADPAEANELSVYGGYVWQTPFAEAGIEWANTAAPVTFSLGAQDGLVYSDEPGQNGRRSSLSLGFGFSEDDPASGLRYSLSGSGRSAFGAPEQAGGTSPYTWQYREQSYSADLSARAGLTLPSRTDLAVSLQGAFSAWGAVGGDYTLSRYLQATVTGLRTFPGRWKLTGSAGGMYGFDPLPAAELNLAAGAGNFHSLYPGIFDYRGVFLDLYADYRRPEGLFKAEGIIRLSPAKAPAVLRVYGAGSSAPVFSTDGAEFFRRSSRYPVYTEFYGRGSQAGYYVGGDAELGLFNLEVQRRAWVFPVFLNRINMAAGYRAAWNGGPYYHSAFARLALVFSPLVGSYSRLHLSLRFEGAYSFTDGNFVFSLF